MSVDAAQRTYTCMACGRVDRWTAGWQMVRTGPVCSRACASRGAIAQVMSKLKTYGDRAAGGHRYLWSEDREVLRQVCADRGIPETWIHWRADKGQWVVKLWGRGKRRGGGR